MATRLDVESQVEQWEPVATAEAGVSVAERSALGTTARVVTWPEDIVGTVLAAVDGVIDALDRQASRFRSDSEISRIRRAPGDTFLVSEGLAQAIAAALTAARWTDGLVDPTVGGALVSLGYDRDFSAVAPSGPPLHPQSTVVPGWASVHLDGRLLRLPPGTILDLGATAKGLGADRAARAASAAISAMRRPGGVLVSLGGDIAMAGHAPDGGWPVRVAEDPLPTHSSASQVVRLIAGALATSSVGQRHWRRGARELHHIVDPRTGWPASGPWRTVSVAAPTCVAANAASTALIVGGEVAEGWLEETGLPARLVGHDGSVRLAGSWPTEDGAPLDIPAVGRIAGPPSLIGHAR